TGMLPSEEIIEKVKDAFLNIDAKAFVIYHVMVCMGDEEVLNAWLIDAMIEHLIPHATIMTPNLVEAGHLTRRKTPKTLEEVKQCAEAITKMGAKHVIIKGGTGIDGDKAVDVYYDGEDFHL